MLNIEVTKSTFRTVAANTVRPVSSFVPALLSVRRVVVTLPCHFTGMLTFTESLTICNTFCYKNIKLNFHVKNTV